MLRKQGFISHMKRKKVSNILQNRHCLKVGCIAIVPGLYRAS